MNKAFFLFVWLIIVQLAFGDRRRDDDDDRDQNGCGVQSSACFGVSTSNEKYADTSNAVYVRLLVPSSNEYKWSQWYKLDNSNCNDLQKGNTDWFNVDNCPDNAVAFAVKQTGSNAWKMDKFYYKNHEVDVDRWISTDINDYLGGAYQYIALDMKGNLLHI